MGFEIVETRDVALSAQELQQQGGGQTWYLPLTPSYNVFSQRFQVRFSPPVVLGRKGGEGGRRRAEPLTPAAGPSPRMHISASFNLNTKRHTAPDSSPPSACP